MAGFQNPGLELGWVSHELIRAEVFSPDRLRRHAESLAAAQPISHRKRTRYVLSKRLAGNEAVLLASYRALAKAVDAGQTISPAAEWILDNFHIIEEQIFEIRTDLPPGYYRELPKLAEGPFAGMPRVFGIAWAYIAHTDSRFDPELLCDFVGAYQSVQPLTIAELWAIPITLRIVLIENLRRAAERIVQRQAQRVAADGYAEQFLAGKVETIPLVLRDLPTPYGQTLVVQLAHRLHDPSPVGIAALDWLTRQIASHGMTIDGAIEEEHARQAAMNVSARNIVTSMREISSASWPDLFERMSLVDRMLREEAGFDRMDFATRDLYRKQIEMLGRHSSSDELAVTRRAIDLAKAAGPGAEARQRDPGYYLIGAGRIAFEKEVGFRPPLRYLPGRAIGHLSAGGYVFVCVLAAVLTLAAVLSLVSGAVGWAAPLMLVLLGSLPAIDLAATIVARVVIALAKPAVLPGLDLDAGIPAEFRTMIVIPTLLASEQGTGEVVRQIEIHYLSNPSDELTFAILSDWTDAQTESTPADESLLRHAARLVAHLNDLHARPDGPRFLLLHRRRVWSETQQCWLGWERKRGKLQEFNRLLRGAADTTFVAIEGVPPHVPEGVRYVITLDSDTQLPRDAAARLIGKMAHVINRPLFDSARRLVTDGYGILQPRVTLSLPHRSEGSWFQWMFSGARGIDPYAAPSSDVYQDLFGEGSFFGKGIYDVDAFEAAMEGRAPDNAILSHDLLESIFVRAGIAGEVEIVEDFPRRYDVAASRQHRWARGDWQLLPWLVEPTKPDAPAPAPLLGRWKLLDNLRRTLSAPVGFVSLLVGWTLPLGPALIWTVFNLLAIGAPYVLPTIVGAFHASRRSTLRARSEAFANDLGTALGQAGFVIVTLVDQAALMADAILRALYRQFVSRRRLLEWVTAEQAARRPELDVLGFYRSMIASPIGAAIAGVVAFSSSFAAGRVALPFVAAWALAPAIACWASRNRQNPALAALQPEQAQQLRLIARSTWRFFETFVTEKENWLPPDNYQDAEPRPAIAHRTSPTNIGLYLISTVAASDFGWIGRTEAVERLENTFGSLRKLFGFRGHFYNWYDTTDLRPLDPQYVSTVDSGNLAGHLIAIANALEEPLATTRERVFAGADDALRLAGEAAGSGFTAIRSILGEFRAGEGPVSANGLKQLADRMRQAAANASTANPEASAWLNAALASVESHARDLAGPAELLVERRQAIAATARTMAMHMDFRFLMDAPRGLMSIGYVGPENRRDSNFYDLLASEARLASFFAIAKRDAPTKHWFKLGRPTAAIQGRTALVSWSGSMFEYLMPSLVMRTPAGSLLETTNRQIVASQIEYGRRLGVPWGVSESAFNARDVEFTYQYSNFGVPGLGLKRGLGSNIVIAPYATALAAMVDPAAAARNFEALAKAGGRGRYGFYESLDYTPSRLPVGADVAVVKAYMAHHQGMSIVALADVLLSSVMRRRFHAEPIIAATELLLEESSPKYASVGPIRAEEVQVAADTRPLPVGAQRRFDAALTAGPQAGLLSNGRYTVMVTNSGMGYSRWNELAVTRWREDPTLEEHGSAIYLRDLRGPRVWSAGYQPTGSKPDSYSVDFADDHVRVVRRDRTIMTTTEVAISAEHDGEVRRVSLTNMGGMDHEIEVTSYAEVVLAAEADDIAHPAFSKMFVQTEYVADGDVLLATRRKRSPDQREIWAAHFVVAGDASGPVEFETDRAKFIGVGRSLRDPLALESEHLTNSAGTVLDPVFSLRRRVTVEPGKTVTLSFWTVVAASREAVLTAVRANEDTASFERAATLAWTQAQIQMRHIGVNAAEASAFQRLAGCLLFPDRGLRADANTLRDAGFDVRALWAHGVSGDLPIVVARFDSSEDLSLARELARAHAYLRLKHFPFDLVLVNDRGVSYDQGLQTELESIARTAEMRAQVQPGTRGRMFVVRVDLLNAESEAALMVSARVVLRGRRGSLAGQVERLATSGRVIATPETVRRPHPGDLPDTGGLEFANGYGGFRDDGREYVVTITPQARPPAPWVNVVANPQFGFLIGADGAGFTWGRNSRENQLTPWSNDPVVNRSGEAIYIRDDDSGALWGPTAHPYRHPAAIHRARHGRGYSRFEHVADGIASDLIALVPLDDPIKIQRLRLTNRSAERRRLSVALYTEFVLGPSRARSAQFIATAVSPGGALIARNARVDLDDGRVAFLAFDRSPDAFTGDRAEFIGRLGTIAEPAGLLEDAVLSGTTGAGYDPCGAMLARLEIPPGETRDVTIFLGSAASVEEADALLAKHRGADFEETLASVGDHWDRILGAITVKTPDRAMDIMLNGWLQYQTLACRVWARSGFYQASGAYGFRDQLQDGLALAVAAPALAREHILRAAARQFPEGDVQHWWLPATGQGVRTHISDDPAWLAFCVAHYVRVTGDDGILEEQVSFIEGPRLAPEEHDAFFKPEVSGNVAPLYEHCAIALDCRLTTGQHGLPLMGTGDWNDGMNLVGAGGKGESVWLAWLLCAALRQFAEVADERGDKDRAGRWRDHADNLAEACETTAWDGGWYRRAFFDDGSPLGSATNDACRIDSIAQSWSVISSAANPERAKVAMAAAGEQLVRRDDGILLLFTPPFDHTALEPGYIKGYPAGLRENGGQYTHGAIWMLIAEAMLGNGTRAAELFAMLNPIHKADRAEAVERYKVEPYVVAADVYSADGHVGRGGWTWYTGSAGWLYRAGVEWILGIRKEGETLRVAPAIPDAWDGFTATLRHGSATYRIIVARTEGQAAGDPIPLADDGQVHEIRILVPRGQPQNTGQNSRLKQFAE
ncbi:glucoamylase family protein [soil metagenome]